jgi:putative two-component system response regulator
MQREADYSVGGIGQPGTAELLVVDDEEALRRWAERVARDGGYTCDGACSAAAARERLDDTAYALVLLDVRMPGESGMGLLGHIRTAFPETAVVMVTGEDDPRLAMSAIEHGAYGYMVKPVRSGELLINIANALHRRRSEHERRQMILRLEGSVQDSGLQLEEALQELRLAENQVWISQAETILRLARLVEFRDEETGHHLQRMSAYCEILAVSSACPSANVSWCASRASCTTSARSPSPTASCASRVRSRPRNAR